MFAQFHVCSSCLCVAHDIHLVSFSFYRKDFLHISCGAGLLVMYSFSFCMTEMVFILPLF